MPKMDSDYYERVIKAKNAALMKALDALEDQACRWKSLACGYEENPDENDTSPEDATAWDAGMAIKKCKSAIASIRRIVG